MAESTRQDLTFTWEGLTLAGTLDAPPSDGAGPAVLMMQGSGPADRDCGGYFPPIRDAFLSNQIATFAFDKPGCGESTGDWRDYGLEDRVNQALAALETLRANPALDSRRVGIWGQSQGGWIVQMLAGRLPDLPFAIANSGPSVGVVEQDLYGCEHEMRSRGHSEGEIEAALAFMTRLHGEAQRGTDFATVEEEFLKDARNEPWYGYAAVEDAADWRLGCKLITEGYEPAKVTARIQCSFLAVYGGRDVLVPAWRSAEETGRALERAGNADATVVVFATGDHRIRDRSSGAFVPGYLDLLGDWAARRTGAAHS
jgi:pimeloyl-ACP methyl ester carboxylesterase